MQPCLHGVDATQSGFNRCTLACIIMSSANTEAGVEGWPVLKSSNKSSRDREPGGCDAPTPECLHAFACKQETAGHPERPGGWRSLNHQGGWNTQGHAGAYS